jgi:hypothetical protein
MMVPGDIIDPATTLEVFIDGLYQRSASLPTPGYQITVIGPNTVFVQWPGSESQIEMRFNPRGIAPDVITL